MAMFTEFKKIVNFASEVAWAVQKDTVAAIQISFRWQGSSGLDQMPLLLVRRESHDGPSTKFQIMQENIYKMWMREKWGIVMIRTFAACKCSDRTVSSTSDSERDC